MIIKKIFEEITFLGGIMFYLLFSLFFLMINKTDYFIQLILGLLFIYLLTIVIRIFYFKPRPKKVHYNNLIEKIDASSFPSVHAARITFISLFILINFLPNLFFTSIILFLNLLVFYSRIYLLKHDLKDIIGGILLGIGISIILIAL